MKVILFSIFIILFLGQCNKNKETAPESGRYYCGTNDPLEGLPWLKDIKTMFEIQANATGGQIIAFRYKGEDVYWIDDCYNCADKLIKVYNCSGEVICEFGGIAGQNTCPDFGENATDSIMLFNNVAPEYVYPTNILNQ